MSESHHPTLGAGIEPKCSRPHAAVTAPDFVEVSPLMRSCIFGFNTHVAELPSSATDVKGSGTSALGPPCKAAPAAEKAVRKVFLSQLPAELLRNKWCNDAAVEKRRRSQGSHTEFRSGVLLENAPWWTGNDKCGVDVDRLFPPELRARLAALRQEVRHQEANRDSRFSAKTATCRKGRQGSRSVPAALRAASSLALGGSGGDITGNGIAGSAPPSLLSPAADDTQPICTALGENGTSANPHNTGGPVDGGEQGRRGLLGALSLSLDKLVERADGETQAFPEDSPSLVSPASLSHRVQDIDENSLRLADVILPLESSSSDKDLSGAGGSLFCCASFSLPHDQVRSFNMLDDIVDPTTICIASDERQANAGIGGLGAVRLPMDAGSIFAEMRTTLLTLLEDLHAATCCCSEASSPEPCGCCVGSLFLVRSKGNDNVSVAVPKNSGALGKAGTARDGIGETPPLAGSPSGTRSPSPAPTRALLPSGCHDPSPTNSVALIQDTDAGTNSGDPNSYSYIHDSLLSKCRGDGTALHAVSPNASRSHLSPSALHTDTEASHDNVRPAPNEDATTGGRGSSGPPSRNDERDKMDFAVAAEVASCTDPGNGAAGHLPCVSEAKSSLSPLQKEDDLIQDCGKDDSGDSLHLLFRHHIAVVACADRFAELLPYSHIFRECIGSYRMPTALPSPARHLLVQELLLLRHDPDRLLARNSFQWTDASGALFGLSEHRSYLPKGGGDADAVQSERLLRGDDTGGTLSPQGSCGVRTEVPSFLREGRNAAAPFDATPGADRRSGTVRMLPLPLLDPTVLLCASQTELAAQKSAVLRILRMLRTLAPSWAARDDNFGFHFKTAITATSLDSPELESYRVILQCLSPFDARQWSRDQLLEVFSDLDCIRLAHRRRRSLRASVARVQRSIEQPDGDIVGNTWHGVDGAAVSRQRWENSSSGGGHPSEVGAPLYQQVVRGGRDTHSGQHATSVGLTACSCASGSTPVLGLVQPLSASKEQPNVLQQAPLQQLAPNGNGAKWASKTSAITATREGATEGVPYAESDGATVDMQALTTGGEAFLLPGTALPQGSARRGQSPVGASASARRNASGSDTGCLTGGKMGNSSPSDCPMRQQYAVRAAELPKIKGVFIGKKHTCWVAQWNDSNGQPRQSCFNIKQHGFEKARCMAVQARQAFMGKSISKPTNTSPSETQRAAAQPVPQAPPITREAASTPARLPDLLFLRDSRTSIAEAFGSRNVQTPTAVLPPLKAKLESIAAATDGHGIQGGHNAAATASNTIPSSLNATQAKLGVPGPTAPRNSQRGTLQRQAAACLPDESSAAPVASQPSVQKQEQATTSSSVSSLASSGAPSKQQLLLQYRLQQQLEEQLQQLQQLQQQLMQQTFTAPQNPTGKLSSLLPDVTTRAPSTSSSTGFGGSSSSALALVNSLLGGSAAGPLCVSSSVYRERADAKEPLGSLSASGSPEGQQQPTASPGTIEPTSELQSILQGLKIPCGDGAACGNSDGGAGTIDVPCSSSEALEEDGEPPCSKRKHRLLSVPKQGKRTLASLARRFPSVPGVTYNVKCACWEVTVKGRDSAKIFSTRKFGTLDTAYRAAVMWKSKVDRGEEVADDADGLDGPEGQEEDCEDLDDSEGFGCAPSPAAWEANLEGDELPRKRSG